MWDGRNNKRRRIKSDYCRFENYIKSLKCLKKYFSFLGVENFTKTVEEIFYVSLEFDHHFDFKTNASKTIRVIHSEIVAEIHTRTEKVFKYISFIGAFTSLFLLWMLIKYFDWFQSRQKTFTFSSRTIQYKQNFLTNLRYKNVFITKKFHEIDEKRVAIKMENVLPLTKSERKSFVELTTFRLVKHEYRMVFEKSIFLLMSTLHVCGVILADYSMFWILSIVQFYGSQNKEIGAEGKLKYLWLNLILDSANPD